MSLLDYRHIGAPFRNGMHLVAIIFIVVLFAIYRFATAGNFDSNDEYRYSPQRHQQSDEQLPLPQGRRDGPFPGFGNSPGKPAQNNQQQNNQGSASKSLDDIEQELGMRGN